MKKTIFFIIVLFLFSGCAYAEQSNWKPLRWGGVVKGACNTDWHYNSANYEKLQRDADAMRILFDDKKENKYVNPR